MFLLILRETAVTIVLIFDGFQKFAPESNFLKVLDMPTIVLAIKTFNIIWRI